MRFTGSSAGFSGGKKPILDGIMRNDETMAWKWAETQVLGKRGYSSGTPDDGCNEVLSTKNSRGHREPPHGFTFPI
jgi:nickel-dependent lactate racemase